MKTVNSLFQMSNPDPTSKPPLLTQWLRSKDHPLVWSGPVILGTVPTVTVELHTKWYGLFIVRVGYDEVVVEQVPFPSDFEFCHDQPPFLDHAPNPVVVARWAAKNGFAVDDFAMEAMIGRWEREYKETYSETYYEPPPSPEVSE